MNAGSWENNVLRVLRRFTRLKSPHRTNPTLSGGSFPMAKARGDFTDILLKSGILSPDQLAEAKALQQQTGAKIQDALVKLGMHGRGHHDRHRRVHGMQFVDLDRRHHPAVGHRAGARVGRPRKRRPAARPRTTASSRSSSATRPTSTRSQKLQFILNKDIQPVLAAREQIIEAINRHYGQTRNRVGRLDARRSSPTPPSTSPRPKRPPSRRRPTTATPRSSSWST